MNKINIYNNTLELFPYEKLLKKIINKSLKKEKIKNANCSVIIVDKKYIKEINKKYRNINKVTDVISFALEDENKCLIPKNIHLLGDIYICYEKAKEQAEEYNHSLKREISFLAVHGLFHLLGYDHQTKEEEKIMFKKQEEVLEKYGIIK